MKNIFSFKYDELVTFLLSIDEKKYRAKQIYEWLYLHKIWTYEAMSNLSKELVNKLNQQISTELIKIKAKETDPEVIKYLFALNDDNYIEAVLMKHDYGNSLCISSQVGCNMGCTFCESGRLKKVRDLLVHEMVGQVLLVETDLKERIDSVVIMGIGEPFDNYDNVMNFIRIINHPFGLAIGARHITISTCGIIPKIDAFAEEALQVNLAVSLHGATDSVRRELMPVSKVYPIKDLIDCLRRYIAKTNRRITIEYVMLMDINDSELAAVELTNLIKGLNVYVNLIPYNETSHLDYKKSNDERIRAFAETLKKAKIDVTIRKAFGRNIAAACGQLRAKEVEK